MRPRTWSFFAAFCVAGIACNFGVNFDGIFGPPAAAPKVDAALDSGPPDAAIPKVPVTQLVAGASSLCGRRLDGTVMCWGYDGPEGRLGDTGTIASSVPVLVKDLKDAIDIAVGAAHACAARHDGTVICWGTNEERQIGDGSNTVQPIPKQVIQLADVKNVIAGEAWSCALKNDGTVVCWGANSAGQLGDGTTSGRSQPMPVQGIPGPATQIMAARSWACALVGTGDVYCWGADPAGGDIRKTAVKIEGAVDVQTLGGGGVGTHMCALTKTRTMLCWGSGGNGELGDGKNATSAKAVPLVGVPSPTGLATGTNFTCASQEGGGASCWGINNWRQLGLGDDPVVPATATTPLPVVSVTEVDRVVTGGAFACALHKGGSKISCWGNNYYGTLGRGTRIVADTPVPVAGTPATLGLGTNHGCAIDAQGALSCWGVNTEGEIGTYPFGAVGQPVPVDAGGVVAQVAGGYTHTCFLMGGAVKCLGRAYEGQLGNVTPGNFYTPQPFGTVNSAVELSANGNSTCARLASGEIDCSGVNYNGQLGASGPGLAVSPQPVLAEPPPPVDSGIVDADSDVDAGPPPPPATYQPNDAIFMGQTHACALHAGGTLACWGDKGRGQCGPAGKPAHVPQDVPLPGPVTKATLGDYHTCALLQDGGVRCFGENQWGQLTGTDPASSVPRTPDLGGQTAKDIAAGSAFTCAILADETVSCWGQGVYGQLGNGVRADSNRPVKVSNLSGAQKIFANGHRTCVILGDGSMSCWGLNWFGQIGEGATMATGTPAPIVGYEQ